MDKEYNPLVASGEEYFIETKNGTPGIMKKYEGSWFPFTKTHLEEVKHHSKDLNLSRGWRTIGYIAALRPLISDIPMLPFTAFYKLKDKLSQQKS